MTDKNGRKIFEHDLVKEFYASGTERKISEIVYCDSPLGMGWHANTLKLLQRYKRDYSCVGIGAKMGAEVEIIGSIFDNPELIGGQQDD